MFKHFAVLSTAVLPILFVADPTFAAEKNDNLPAEMFEWRNQPVKTEGGSSEGAFGRYIAEDAMIIINDHLQSQTRASTPDVETTNSTENCK